VTRNLAAWPVVLAVFAVGLGLTACGKKSAANPEEYPEVVNTFDDSEPAADQRKPVEGADLAGLSEADRGRFERLADSLPSPCGKPHSLRTSRNTDPTCVRARFAVDYVIALVGDGFTNKEVGELFASRYRQNQPRRGFKLDGAPHTGPEDARVVMVEFFDYGCPACGRFKPVLEAAQQAFPSDAVIYYKQFPLGADTQPAAHGAMAAHAQGKFKEMHDLLFETRSHKKEQVFELARKIGLDMTRFEADFVAVEARVRADRAEGEDAGIHGTPSLFINGRLYEGLEHPKYLKMWIEEELAAGR
jgi:protein-disulfide isomerase